MAKRDRKRKVEKLWGGRFKKKTSALFETFTAGRDTKGILPADEKLIPYDLWGNRAHVVMLAKQRIISKHEARTLIRGLREIEDDWLKGKFRLDPWKEDVHSAVESQLIARYGLDIGGKIHTGRSRNDQIALDMRLYMKEQALEFISGLVSLLGILLRTAQKHRGKIFPGFTHHQVAQITSLGHFWLSFAEELRRDIQRFQEWYVRFNENPLGSMTGYGTSFPIDKNFTSKVLGFDGPCPNTLDPIQCRWEPEAELAFVIATMMNHLSSLAQNLIILSMEEFALFRLDDSQCSGSSMMPQKRNPDALEVVKAKASLAHGILASLLSIGRGLFLGYNRDQQWTKYLIMDVIDETLPAAGVMAETVRKIKVDDKRLIEICRRGFIAAPDFLEKMVQDWGGAFRQAKMAVEKAVKYSEQEAKEEISEKALRKALMEEGVDFKFGERYLSEAQDPQRIIARRKAIGGTSSEALGRHYERLSRFRGDTKKWFSGRKREPEQAKRMLAKEEKALSGIKIA
jgi:argininosuccinate lyase